MVFDSTPPVIPSSYLGLNQLQFNLFEVHFLIVLILIASSRDSQ